MGLESREGREGNKNAKLQTRAITVFIYTMSYSFCYNLHFQAKGPSKYKLILSSLALVNFDKESRGASVAQWV